MIQKESYVQHIIDSDLKHLLIKILDKVEAVIKNHDIKITDFLNPYELKAATDILNAFQEIRWIETGGYEEAERKILIIFQDYMSIESIPIPLIVLEVASASQFNTLNHRDYLGALLSLGIKREKVGDIIVSEKICHIVLQEDLKDYVIFQLNQVKNVSVSTKEVEFEEIKLLADNYKEISGSVASLRLDSIVSLGFRIPRSEAQTLVSKEKVYINWGVASKNFHEIDVGDVISVRGKGRVIVDDIQGKTKSGRIHIKLRKPI
ncbi:RNA-binding protein YlmH, contains S4-like domain [Anaerovirgula multivorans]|uniref:RNA-binding protein YlmH, contains S4-like domain n=1 Tax=Anaerovirgula multivorans TaxID=312168 RepID=A0A239A7W7_9FIRM|nr:YlmH/Sll1252 family protein [Anaerovirgula multivorans]SNR91134.1 RNA-binding protein YlmH, contains S4-like domain [Anaerovirgula multivorans]